MYCVHINYFQGCFVPFSFRPLFVKKLVFGKGLLGAVLNEAGTPPKAWTSETTTVQNYKLLCNLCELYLDILSPSCPALKLYHIKNVAANKHTIKPVQSTTPSR